MLILLQSHLHNKYSTIKYVWQVNVPQEIHKRPKYDIRAAFVLTFQQRTGIGIVS